MLETYRIIGKIVDSKKINIPTEVRGVIEYLNRQTGFKVVDSSSKMLDDGLEMTIDVRIDCRQVLDALAMDKIYELADPEMAYLDSLEIIHKSTEGVIKAEPNLPFAKAKGYVMGLCNKECWVAESFEWDGEDCISIVNLGDGNRKVLAMSPEGKYTGWEKLSQDLRVSVKQ